MFYQGFQAWTDLVSPFRNAARMALTMNELTGPLGDWPAQRYAAAALDVFAGAGLTHRRPPFGIDSVTVGDETVEVREEIAASLPFCELLHFAKDAVSTTQPKMLVVAPLSGHFATLLRSTVRTLLSDHDVYVTDWRNARDVPMGEGAFGFDDYVDYVIRFLELIGPRAHVLAVCQPCVQTLAAVAILAEDESPAQPRTMTLMGGPIDTREAPTSVNDLALSKPISWFEDTLISSVPYPHAGHGRRVYPGFVQLTAFMSMNPERHVEQHRTLFKLLAEGRDGEARAIKNFYTEYFAVLDMTAEFYLETVERVFQEALLARGELDWRGRRVDPAAIRRTAILTVEGERDDICAVGQTAAAHDLCSSLRPHLKRHHHQPGVGHYGLFAGHRWRQQIYPQVRNLVLAMS